MNKAVLLQQGRKILACGCAVLLLGAGGCSFSRQGELVVTPQAEQSSTALNFFGNKADLGSRNVIESTLQGFLQRHKGVSMTYEAVKGNEYYSVLRKRLTHGVADDIFFLNHDVYLELAGREMLADLQDLTAVQALDENLLERDLLGRVYWVPTTVSAFGLYVNEDLLRQHGQPVPHNLAEWRQVNDYFVSLGITPVIANNDISLKTMAIGASLYPCYQQGKTDRLFDDLQAGRVRLSEVLRPGFLLVDEFLQKGYVNPVQTLGREKTKDDLAEFVKGEAPFMLTGAWAANRVKAAGPDFSFAVYPLPVLPEGSVLVVNADTRLAVNVKTANVLLAKEFVNEFCATENLAAFCREQVSFSPVKGASPSHLAEIEPLQQPYRDRQYVIGSDDRLHLPVWTLTRQAVLRLLQGGSLEQALLVLDGAAAERQEK